MNMNIIFILICSIIFAFIIFVVKILQITDRERPPNSRPLILLRTTPVRSLRITAVSVPINNINQAIPASFPQQLGSHRRILTNLIMTHCQITKVDQFMYVKGTSGRTKPRRRPLLRIPIESYN